MKKILMLAVAGISVFALAKGPSKAQLAKIAKQDKANWGNVDYSGAADGENSVANDYAQIRSMTRGEAKKMSELFKFCNSLLHGAKIVDVEPETVLGAGLQELNRPIDPTPARQLLNLNLTPNQKRGVESLLGAKKALAMFEKTARAKMRVLLKTEIEKRLYSDYNRMVRVATFEPIRNGSIMESFKRIDTAWGRYLKLLEQIGNGTDKWKYPPANLLDASQRKKLFAEVLKESDLDCAFNADARMHPKTQRFVYLLDNYFKRVTDSDVARLKESYAQSYVAHNATVAAHQEFNQWFTENGMALDPYAREIIKELFAAHVKYVHESRELVGDCDQLVKELRDESLPVGKLRKCKGFSSNKAFFVRSGEVSERPPAYVRRMNELSREARKLFGDAVEKRIATAGRIQI